MRGDGTNDNGNAFDNTTFATYDDDAPRVDN